MHVTVVCNDSAYFLRHRRPVADALVSEGHEVTVMTGGSPLSEEESGGWQFRHLQIERFAFAPIGDLRLFLESVVQFVRSRSSAIYLITLKPAVFSGLAAVMARGVTFRRVPIVIAIPGLGRLLGASNVLHGARHDTARKLVKRAIRFISNGRDVWFVFETDADRNAWLSEGLVRTDNSETIAGAGVDETVYFPGAESPGVRRPLHVLFASRLLRTKGLDVFVDVAREFAGSKDIRFLVAGMIEPGDPDGVAPVELASDPAIAFLGRTDDMAPLLRSTDLVCLPTRYGEGIPRILIEAAASGVASIASDVDGCLQIVTNGVSGRIIPQAGPEARAGLTRALNEYLARPDLLREHGEAALRRFREGGFSLSNIVGRYLELLRGPDRP